MINPSGINGQDKIINRNPVVAGQFYPGSADELLSSLSKLYSATKMTQNENPIRALLVPHAGYEFSGLTAAEGYRQLVDIRQYDNIFILASSHKVSLDRASIYTPGNYITPLGEVKVNMSIAEELHKHECFTYEPSAHSEEHSIEVQLPFLQFFGNMPPIIPIVVASHSPDIAKDIAEALKPWFTPNNLFIVSADFSHYPKYDDAIRIDNNTANAFCSGSTEEFLETLDKNERESIRGLATSMCAWPAALVLLYLTNQENKFSFEKISYSNSGDHKLYGDKRRVVGYHAISIRDSKPESEFYLSNYGKNKLLELSRNCITETYNKKSKFIPAEDSFPEELHQIVGAFVSLKVEGKLRGCIGNFESSKPLYQLIPELTLSSAKQDSRFLPVNSREIKDICIEISVLGSLIKIDNINQIVLGKHGIYIKKENSKGTFLPQVAVDFGWTLEEFLGRCSRDKAGLGYSGWKDADIYIYEAKVFKELK